MDLPSRRPAGSQHPVLIPQISLCKEREWAEDIYQGKRMDRLLLWLSKYQAKQLWRNIFIFESLCKQKPSCRFWINRSDRPMQLVWPPDYWKYQFGYERWFITEAEDQDWRVHIISYLKILVKVQKGIFGGYHSKNVLLDDKLYRWVAEDLFLKCLNSDQTRVFMRKVHEDVCGTH